MNPASALRPPSRLPRLAAAFAAFSFAVLSTLSTSAQGLVYVANTNAGTIAEYTTAGVVVNASLVTGLTFPYGVAVSGSSLYVTNATGRIGVYDSATGAVINASLITGLVSPRTIAVSGGNIYIPSEDNGTVGIYNATTGAVINATLISGLTQPYGVAVSGSDLYVSNGGSAGRIGKYNASTGAATSASLITGLSFPQGITVSGTTLYVTGSSKVAAYDTTTGAAVNATLVSGLSGPRGVAVFGSSLFVTSANAGTVGAYDATAGTAVNASLISGFNFPTGIAAAAAPAGPAAPSITTQPAALSIPAGISATFTVTASGGTLTYQWKFNGTILTGAVSFTLRLTNIQFANAGSYTVEVTNTTGTTTSSAAILTVTPAVKEIFVTNIGGTGTLGEYSSSGATVNASLLTGLGAFRPYGLALAGSNLYVTKSGGGDPGQGTVSVYTTAGATVNATLISGLNLPFGIAVSGTDLYVVNRNTGIVGKYNATTGTAINASLITGLNDPCAITVSGTDLYVTVVGNGAGLGSVGKYTTAGAVVNAALVTGLSGPYGVAVSGSDLFVSTNGSGANRVGKYNATTGATQNATFITGLNLPYGLAVSGAYLYVANNGNNTIGVYDTATGTAVNAALVSGLNSPSGLAVAATPIPAGYLSNLSVRAATDASKTLIAGFVVDGGFKQMLVRAGGPLLNRFFLTGVTDPSLALYSLANTPATLVASNNDWDSAATPSSLFTTLGAQLFDTASKDSALKRSVNGPHTANVTATNTGQVIAEVYDADPNDGRQLTNLSARFQVGIGDNILIAGFVLGGTGTKQLLIRAVGSKLADYGVTGVLADPQFSVFDGSTVIDTNNDWSSTLTSTFTTLGAFSLNTGTGLPTNDTKSAAKVLTLDAGKPYTVQVSGVGNTTGEALVEIYLIP